MNVNSTKRIYIPFGARGTVIGKTEESLLIMFDEAFISGTNIYSHCPQYHGAQVHPRYLLNLSKTFAGIASQDRRIIKRFEEKPLEGVSEFA